MSHQLAHFGYQVQSVRSYTRLLELLEIRSAPMPSSWTCTSRTPTSVWWRRPAEVHAGVGRELPVLFLTESADIEDRLRAARL